MIPILLLDFAGVVLVIGYVLLDRRQNDTSRIPDRDQAEPSQPTTGSRSLPIEPIVAQRPLPANLEPRRIRRPSRAPSQTRSKDPANRN